MSDLEVLFLVLALIYGCECACWARRGSVTFRTWFGRRWRPAHPSALMGNQRGGVVFGHPLPPLGTLLTGNQFPLSLSAEAVLAHVAPSVNPGWRPVQTGKFLRLNEIRNVEASGKKVFINGEVLVKASSATFATFVAQQLRQLIKLPVTEREGIIRKMIQDSFDTKAIENLWQNMHGETGRIRLLTNCLFGYLFLAAPVLCWFLGFRQCWASLLAGLLVLTATTAVIFRRIHKTFYPAAEDERFTQFLTVLLSPATTIRAHDLLSRPLLEGFHPLAIAKVFCAEAEFREFAQSILREIRHPGLPVCPREEQAAQMAERHSRTVLSEVFEQFLKQSGVEPTELARPPARADDTSRSYCPRCLAQFTTTEGICADCGGLPLAPFPAEETEKQKAR